MVGWNIGHINVAPLSTIYHLCRDSLFYWRSGQMYLEKWATSHQALWSFIALMPFYYIMQWAKIELTTSVGIMENAIGWCKSKIVAYRSQILLILCMSWKMS